MDQRKVDYIFEE